MSINIIVLINFEWIIIALDVRSNRTVHVCFDMSQCKSIYVPELSWNELLLSVVNSPHTRSLCYRKEG